MHVGERIQALRKLKGLSQEQLADVAGVSRQAVSKWESNQSMPDVEKIIWLSDYFAVTTDYLLKGIECYGKDGGEEKVFKKAGVNWDAKLFSTAGTILNAMGLILAITIWTELQVSYAAGVGIMVMLAGTGIFLTGQILDAKDKGKAKCFFVLVNIWILPFIPLACCFNFVDGLFGGYFGMIAPVPMPGNSFVTFALYWMVYVIMCITVDFIVARGKAIETGA